MSSPVLHEDLAQLRQELAATRLHRDQLRHALGRILDMLTARAGRGFFLAGVAATTVFEWRNLYERSGGRGPRGGRKPGKVTDAAVIVGEHTDAQTEAVRTQLLDAGLTERAAEVRRAQKICSHCCVLHECRDYAVRAEPHVYGIWGGLTDGQRTRLRKQRRAAA